MSSRQRHSWMFYYDGDCAFCTRVVRGLSRIDFFGRLTWVPYQTLESPPGGLSWQDLDRSAYLETRADRFHEGFFAFRMLALRLLPLLPLAPVLWFPGVSVAGTAAYRWVARNRHRLSRCRIPGFKAGR